MNVVRKTPFWLVVLSVISLVSGAARATVYVVDRAAPGAADTNRGSEEKPFRTVQHAAMRPNRATLSTSWRASTTSGSR